LISGEIAEVFGTRRMAISDNHKHKEDSYYYLKPAIASTLALASLLGDRSIAARAAARIPARSTRIGFGARQGYARGRLHGTALRPENRIIGSGPTRTLVPVIIAATALFAGRGGSPSPAPRPSITGGKPEVTLNIPAAGATELSGKAYNVEPASTKVVIYALTNERYVEPFADAPLTDISADGSWTSSAHAWQGLAVLLDRSGQLLASGHGNHQPRPRQGRPGLDPSQFAGRTAGSFSTRECCLWPEVLPRLRAGRNRSHDPILAPAWQRKRGKNSGTVGNTQRRNWYYSGASHGDARSPRWIRKVCDEAP
jgi:hypothetical protein